MQPKPAEAERLLLLTLTLEAAIQAENWPEVTEILKARSGLLDCLTTCPATLADEITAVEERMLTTLRQRLRGIRSDLRNLSAALRIASPYLREQQSSLSLAG